MINQLPFIDVGGVWHVTYFIGISCILPFFIFISLGKDLPLFGKLLWCYLLLWCVFLIEYPSLHFGPYTREFQSTTSQVALEAIFIPYAAIYFNGFIKKVIPYLAGFSTLCVWFNFPGLLHAPSFNMALAALCIPAIESDILVSAIILTALTHHGSTALLIMAAQTLACVFKKEIKWTTFFTALSIFSISAYIFQDKFHFNSGAERLEKWISFMLFWSKDLKHVLLGVGPGSFIWYSIMEHQAQSGFYLQMHCDYLEVAWALGLVGIFLMVGFIIEAVRRACRDSLKTLAGLLGCLAFMLTYEPLEYFPTALLIAYFFVNALVVKKVHVEFSGLTWPIKSNY